MSGIRIIRTLALFLVLLCTLSACGERIQPQDVFTYQGFADGYTVVGDTIYTNISENTIDILNGASDAVRHNLCLDPLCDHESGEDFCPDNRGWLQRKHLTSDGETLYISYRNEKPLTEGKNALIQIYAVSPTDGTMKLLAECENPAYGGYLTCFDGYLYYMQETPRDTRESSGEAGPIYRLMRIPTGGGKAENVLEYDFSRESPVEIDDQNYYVIGDAGQNLTVFSRKDGTKTEYIPTDAVGNPLLVSGVCRYQGEIYLFCLGGTVLQSDAGDTDTSYRPFVILHFLTESMTTEVLADCVSDARFADGALWYEPAELRFLGTKEVPTGRGDETHMVSFWQYGNGTLVRHSLSDGTETTYTLRDAEEGTELHFIGISDGYVLASYENRSKQWILEEAFDRETVHKLIPEENGTLTENGIFS